MAALKMATTTTKNSGPYSNRPRAAPMASESLAFHLLCDKQHMRACAELRVSQGLELVHCCRQEEKKKAAATTTTVTSTTTTTTTEMMREKENRAAEREEEEQFRSEVEDCVLELVDLSWELLRIASREQLLGAHFMRRPVDEYCAGEGEGVMEEGAGSEAWPFVKMIDLEACSEAIDGVLGQLMEFLNSAEREEEERKYGNQSSDDEGDSDDDEEEDDEEKVELDQDSQREGEEAESKRRQQKLLEAALCERRTPGGRPHRALRVTCRDASPR